MTLYFDFDGTLHESMHIYYPAFLKGYEFLVESGRASPRDFDHQEVSKWLGYSSAAMWDTFMPNLPLEVKNAAKQVVGKEMRRLLENGSGKLYEGTAQTLKALKEKGHRLVFLSNCGEAYMHVSIKVFNLDAYFDAFVCAGQYEGLTKTQILGKIRSHYPGNAAVIGDRFHDVEAGVENHLYTVGCAYGYGSEEELTRSDVIIKDITELVDLF